MLLVIGIVGVTKNAEPADDPISTEDKKKMWKKKGKIWQKAYRDRILASKYCDE